MTKPVDPYSRLYWRLIDDPKFAEVYDDDESFALWARLLMTADMAWPTSAALPFDTKRKPLAKLVDVKLIDLLPAKRFRVHGLDAERAKRQNRRGDDADPAGDPAGTPPGPNGSPTGAEAEPAGDPSGTGPDPRMHARAPEPSREEKRREEKRRAKAEPSRDPDSGDQSRTRPGPARARAAAINPRQNGRDREASIARARATLADPNASPAMREVAIAQLNRLGAPIEPERPPALDFGASA